MFHVGDIVEEIATKREGKLDEVPQGPTAVLRWRVLFSDGEQPLLKYFLNDSELRLVKCPHDSSGESRFVPQRGIMD